MRSAPQDRPGRTGACVSGPADQQTHPQRSINIAPQKEANRVWAKPPPQPLPSTVESNGHKPHPEHDTPGSPSRPVRSRRGHLAAGTRPRPQQNRPPPLAVVTGGSAMADPPTSDHGEDGQTSPVGRQALRIFRAARRRRLALPPEQQPRLSPGLVAQLTAHGYPVPPELHPNRRNQPPTNPPPAPPPKPPTSVRGAATDSGRAIRTVAAPPGAPRDTVTALRPRAAGNGTALRLTDQEGITAIASISTSAPEPRPATRSTVIALRCWPAGRVLAANRTAVRPSWP